MGRKSTGPTFKALQQAINKRKPTDIVLFYTDRGAEYRTHIVKYFPIKQKVKASMNHHCCCTDNAEVESFFHSLKAELIRGNKF
jgi:transposase InsO family protein